MCTCAAIADAVIHPQVLDRLHMGSVLEGFLYRENPTFHAFLKQVPLYVIVNEKLGLLGAREFATRLLV